VVGAPDAAVALRIGRVIAPVLRGNEREAEDLVLDTLRVQRALAELGAG
jgi:hypothetical protein